MRLGRLQQCLRSGRGTSSVTLRYPDGREAGTFLPKFLRENTQEAWDSSSKQRLDFRIDTSLQVTEAQAVKLSGAFNGPAFRLSFSDGHVGHFVSPVPQPKMWMQELKEKPRKLWGKNEVDEVQKEMSHGSLRFDFEELQQRDVAQRWIEAMHCHGVALVSNMPSEPLAVKRFAENLGTYLLPSVYGEVFQIKSVTDPNNLAYSNLGLQMHTDLPFNEQPPGIQLFHCLQQADEGGESIAMDGWQAAQSLFEEDPEAFHLLCKHPLRFQDVTSEWFLAAEHPTFEVTGNSPQHLRRLNFNERTRDSWRNWDPAQLEQMAAIYEALQKYEKLVEETSRYVSLRLMPGEMICTDNWRVMHSRSSFLGSRHFVGAYLDWDAVSGRWRSLSNLFRSQWDMVQ